MPLALLLMHPQGNLLQVAVEQAARCSLLYIWGKPALGAERISDQRGHLQRWWDFILTPSALVIAPLALWLQASSLLEQKSLFPRALLSSRTCGGEVIRRQLRLQDHL